ncbi:TRAP transporter small permease [Marinobacterium mangrovicola]|uniref:TRAP transporter small permease protein n=1 Tax=Marinobacterium mangrovicola TaxID=1476959 RepID=A0A4R1G882_9GAMM|nr:TRAP transporter small permease [Marinobacterium mangrovicola]TCK02725.1 TRAP-type C4-dicarboxylate transport system permease small subunit [Marinobacterium mangrovicola]
MSANTPNQSAGQDAVGRGLAWVSRQFALVGGLIMLALATMTVVSIIGRATIGVSVEGDYELVELGLAAAVFLFLPECYLKQGHVVVDLFTAGCKPSTLRILDKVADVLFLIVAVVLAWRLTVSGFESRDYFEQTMILSMPMWWVYAVGVICMVLMGLCSLHKLVFFWGQPK